MPGMNVGYNPYVYSPSIGLGQPASSLDATGLAGTGVAGTQGLAGTGLAGTSLFQSQQPIFGGGGGGGLGSGGGVMQLVQQLLQMMLLMFQMMLGGGGLPFLGNSGTAGGNAGTAGTGNGGTAGTGIAGNNVGNGGTNIGGGGNNGVAGTNNGVAGTNYGYPPPATDTGYNPPPATDTGYNPPPATDTGYNPPVYPPVEPPPAEDTTPVYPPVYPPPAEDTTPVYPPVEPPPAEDTTPVYPPVEPPPAEDTTPVYPPHDCPPPATDTDPPYEPPPYEDGKDSTVWGDPHFVGFGGEKYDVMGKAGNIYNILSDKGVQVNAKFEQWGKGDATVMGEVGIQAGTDQIRFDRSGAAPTVNGTVMEVGKEIQLANGGSATWNGKELQVNTGEYNLVLDVKDNATGDYIDINASVNGNPLADGVAAHGLLGQTADGVAGAKVGDGGQDQGKQGGTVIDGTVDDYVVSDLFATTGPNPNFFRFNG